MNFLTHLTSYINSWTIPTNIWSVVWQGLSSFVWTLGHSTDQQWSGIYLYVQVGQLVAFSPIFTES